MKRIKEYILLDIGSVEVLYEIKDPALFHTVFQNFNEWFYSDNRDAYVSMTHTPFLDAFFSTRCKVHFHKVDLGL